MVDSIKSVVNNQAKSSEQDFTGFAVHENSSLPSDVDANKVGTLRRTSSVSEDKEDFGSKSNEDQSQDLRAGMQAVHLAPIKTFADIEAEQKKTLRYMLIDVRKIIHLVTSSVCALTAVASGLLSEKNNTRIFLEKASTGLAKLAIGVISGISGAVDAFKDGKYLLALSQIGDAVTTVVSPAEEITNYRGVWVGAYNALPALETIEGKSKYESLGDNVKTTWSAFKRALVEIKESPGSIVDPARSGMLGVLTGTLTTISSLLYMITGAKVFASMRDLLGMGVEVEKLKSTHYEAGRSKYIASGWTMLAGSAANMASKYTDKGKDFWSYLNLSANAIGKLFYLDALQSNEPARHQDPVTFKEVIKNTLNDAFDWGKETRASLERSQPTVIPAPEIQERINRLRGSTIASRVAVQLHIFFDKVSTNIAGLKNFICHDFFMKWNGRLNSSNCKFI